MSKSKYKYAPYSHSRINTAYTCPKKFFYSYLAIGTNRTDRADAGVGKLVHKFIDEYNQHLFKNSRVTNYDYGQRIISKHKKFLVYEDDRELFQAICENYMFTNVNDELLSYDELEIAVDNSWERLVPWNDESAYFRGIIDKISFEIDHDAEEFIIHVTDYKTGFSSHGNEDQLMSYVKLARAFVFDKSKVYEKMKKRLGLSHYSLSDRAIIEIKNPRPGAEFKGWARSVDLDKVHDSIRNTDKLISEVEKMRTFKGTISSFCDSCNHIDYCDVFNRRDKGLNLAKKWIQAKKDAANLTANIKSFVNETKKDIEYEGGVIGFVNKTSYKFVGEKIIRFLLEYAMMKYDEDLIEQSVGEYTREEYFKKVQKSIWESVEFNEAEMKKVMKSIGLKPKAEDLLIIRDCLAATKGRTEFGYREKEEVGANVESSDKAEDISNTEKPVVPV